MALHGVLPVLFAILQAIPVWRLLPELRIGSADDPEQAFTGAFDVVVRGDVAYSVHENEQRLRMWDGKGKLLREIGRSGQGPGEFAGPVRAGWKGDTLWVYDSRQARISFFTPAGDFVRSVTALAKVDASDKSSTSVAGNFVMADGTLLGRPQLSAAVQSDKAKERMPLLRFREDGVVIDTVFSLEVGHVVMEVKKPNAAMYMSQPFTDHPLGGPNGRGDGFFIVRRDEARGPGRATFRVTRLALNGDAVFDKFFYYVPKPVTSAQFDELVENHVKMLTESNGPFPAFMPDVQSARRAVREAMYRPRFHPPIASVHAGADGTLWLQREDDGKPERLWQVMDERGRFIAAVRIPRKDRVHYATRQYVWVSQQGELDVPMLVKYRVVPARTR